MSMEIYLDYKRDEDIRMERRAVVESNHHRKGRDHCQSKHYRKTLDEVLRVGREQDTEPSKYL